uniref:Uncharacterized protein n=1 Tax=Oryza sativa subsp. japonica TaxID=39947 RepID=Q5Z4J6_ORYSJ|nr:hypothetical protein [Oryza sativa Japonica Group]
MIYITLFLRNFSLGQWSGGSVAESKRRQATAAGGLSGTVAARRGWRQIVSRPEFLSKIPNAYMCVNPRPGINRGTQ